MKRPKVLRKMTRGLRKVESWMVKLAKSRKYTQRCTDGAGRESERKKVSANPSLASISNVEIR